MKIGIFFREKVKSIKISTECQQIFGNSGEILNRGKCIIASGGWTPLIVGTLYMYRQAFWRRNDYAQFRSLIAIDRVIDMFRLTYSIGLYKNIRCGFRPGSKIQLTAFPDVGPT